MITRVMGKVTETYWYVESNNHEEHQADGTIRTVFDKRPELKSDVIEREPVEICRYEGEPYRLNYLYIGEEEVCSKRITFHADLEEFRQFVNKIVTNTDINRDDSEEKYKLLLRDYNKQSIEGDEKLLAYCKLHHLNLEETDVDELRKVVHPQNTNKFSFSANGMTIMTSDSIAKVML